MYNLGTGRGYTVREVVAAMEAGAAEGGGGGAENWKVTTGHFRGDGREKSSRWTSEEAEAGLMWTSLLEISVNMLDTGSRDPRQSCRGSLAIMAR